MRLQRARELFSDERGSVESHLTIIPLTILFLLTLQLTALASWHVLRIGSIEGESNRAAITGAAGFSSSSQPGSFDTSRFSSPLSSSSRSSSSSPSGSFNPSSSSSRSISLRYQPLVGGGHIAVLEESQEIPFLTNFVRLIPGLSLEGALFRHRSISLSEVFSE